MRCHNAYDDLALLFTLFCVPHGLGEWEFNGDELVHSSARIEESLDEAAKLPSGVGREAGLEAVKVVMCDSNGNPYREQTRVSTIHQIRTTGAFNEDAMVRGKVDVRKRVGATEPSTRLAHMRLPSLDD